MPDAILLHAGDRAYVTWPITGVPVDATCEVSINGGAWGPIARPTLDTVRTLLATPTAPADGVTPDATLHAGRNTYALRVSDSPEVTVSSGLIHVID